MKAQELRIGNWVFMGEYYGDEQITPYQIYQLSLKGNDQDISVAEYYKQVKPIPLTEEWLIKFGFKNVNSDNRYVFLNQVVLHKTNGFLLSPFDTYRKLEYVHQLQNLYFALTGEELEITQ